MLSFKIRRWIPGSLVCIVLIIFSSCAPFFIKTSKGGADNQIVRILVLKTKDTVTISSRSALKITQNNRLISQDQPVPGTYTYNPGSIDRPVTIEPQSEPILMNGQPYRGYLVLNHVNNMVMVINVLKIDEYLMSVVPGEIPANWEEEALKAQAVASRTYTYYHLLSNHTRIGLFDLDATSSSQVYHGIVDEKPRTTDAVKSTTGEILVYENKPILSYFHSTCGGKTIDDRYVWNKSHLPYLRGVRCGFCNDSTKYSWESKLLLEEIRLKLSHKHPEVNAIQAISFRKKDDRVVEVIIKHDRGKLSMSGNNFRLLFSPEKIRSMYFSSKKLKDGLMLTGHGWGHGVGLCQWGSRGMALRGYSYQKILNHYYHDIRITGIRNVYIASGIKKPVNYQ